MKYTRIHVYEYTERMFASNLSHRDRKPKYLIKRNKQILNKTWWWWQAMAPHPIPLPFLAPWPSRPPAIETPPRPVSARPLISWQIPPRASRASLPPRRWAMPHHRLSLRPFSAPLSCSAPLRLSSSSWDDLKFSYEKHVPQARFRILKISRRQD